MRLTLIPALAMCLLLQYFPTQAHAQVPPIATDSIGTVIAAKLMTNYPDGNFHAERLMSRAELAATLVKTFKLDKRQTASPEIVIQLQDIPTSHWAFNDIQTVLKTGVMKGYRGNLFFPNQKVTRAEALAIFAQAYGVFQFPDNTVNEVLATYPDAASIPQWARKAMATSLNEGFVNLDPQRNIHPLQPITRGDMAYTLSKYLQRQQKPGSIENRF